MKKILVVDDSALMRSVICDIINSDKRFQVADRAFDGLQAFDYLSRNTYDAVVLDVNMPRMNGLELLKELRKYHIPAKVCMASTDTKDGARITMEALELGAMDFVHKPDNARDCRMDSFKEELLSTLSAVADSKPQNFSWVENLNHKSSSGKVTEVRQQTGAPVKRIVAIASSTGGPRALQEVIPKLPSTLNAPVLVVQHMPKGFTASLAERLNSLSELSVKEAEDGMELQNGTVYVAPGGKHMNVRSTAGGKYTIYLSDEPNREGVKPCANYMYESLSDSQLDDIVCVVMTGMGSDGTEGIRNLKKKKKVHVISQSKDTCTIYGMPKSVETAGFSNRVAALEQIAQEITLRIGT